MRRADLGDLLAFAAVADHLSFRAAAAHLGVTPSALSHTIRQLEARLGLRLLNRTTRSVALTNSGERLLDQLRPALLQIQDALDHVEAERKRPFGTLRLHATLLSAVTVIVPIWHRFLAAYPDVFLELEIGDALTDIVVRQFDAGIGPRNRASSDMVALRLTGLLKVAFVASPAYFARRRPPRNPEDLAEHDCILYRRANGERVTQWAFQRRGVTRSVAVDGRVMVNSPEVNLRAALDGLGIAYAVEAHVEPLLRSGQLVRVLEEWSPAVDGIFLYYPAGRQIPAALRALIDLLRRSARAHVATE